jgi:hypothetical protein
MQASTNQAEIPTLRCHLNTQKLASCDITFNPLAASQNPHDANGQTSVQSINQEK